MDLSFNLQDFLTIAPGGIHMAIGWLLPAATLISGYLGYKSSKDANKTQQAAINAQQTAEQQKMSLINDNISIADEMLKGGGNFGPGAEKRSEQWTSDYLSWLKSSPDVTYNAQRGQMEGNIRASMEQAARAMGQRGLTGGVSASNMAGLGMQRAGMLAEMEAGRYARQGQNLATGQALTSTMLNNALNMRSGATGNALNFQSQIPNMMAQRAQGQAAQGQAFEGLAGSLIGTMMNQQRTAAPAAAQPAPAAAQPAPTYSAAPSGTVSNQFYSYTPAATNYASWRYF
jgi:hypothetical protein